MLTIPYTSFYMKYSLLLTQEMRYQMILLQLYPKNTHLWYQSLKRVFYDRDHHFWFLELTLFLVDSYTLRFSIQALPHVCPPQKINLSYKKSSLLSILSWGHHLLHMRPHVYQNRRSNYRSTQWHLSGDTVPISQYVRRNLLADQPSAEHTNDPKFLHKGHTPQQSQPIEDDIMSEKSMQSIPPKRSARVAGHPAVDPPAKKRSTLPKTDRE